MHNTGDFEYDMYIYRTGTRGSLWEVRKARRQLNRKWAVRIPRRGNSHVKAYCEYLCVHGNLTGDHS